MTIIYAILENIPVHSVVAPQSRVANGKTLSAHLVSHCLYVFFSLFLTGNLKQIKYCKIHSPFLIFFSFLKL